MKTVKDILSSTFRNGNTINEDAVATDAFALMERNNSDYVIVMEGSSCVGIMSEVDYMNKIILARKDPAKTKVKDIMTSSICAVDLEEPVYRCLELMETFKIRHLLVFEGFSLKGVITLHDLMHASFEENIENLLEQDQAKYILSNNFPCNQQHYRYLYN